MEEYDESFVIKNDNSANWAVKAIAEDLAERDRLISIAENEIANLNIQIENIKEKYEKKTSFLKSCLAAYFSTVKHNETKTQETYKLLDGTLVLKKPSLKITYDDSALLEYLKANNNAYVKTKSSIDWAEFKKQLTVVDDNVIVKDTGEVVNACSIEETPAVFDIKF